MRIAVFTGNRELEKTPFWAATLRAPGLTAVLTCRQRRVDSPSAALRRQLRNIRKHGLIWIPYRMTVAVLGAINRGGHDDALLPEAPAGVSSEVLEVESLHDPDTIQRITEWAPDLGVSLGAPILKPALFRIPRLGTINLHSGKVPEFRGAPPGFWELYTGAQEIGATVHWVDEGLDTGPVLAQAIAPIYPRDTLPDVQERAAELGALCLETTFERLHRGDLTGTPQTASGRTYRAPLVKERLRFGVRMLRARLRRAAWASRIPKTVAYSASLWLIRPVRDWARKLRKRHPVRVFTFHRVWTLSRDGMSVPPDLFRRQVEYIRRHHAIVTLDEALATLNTGRRLERPMAVLTFDDGYGSVYRQARPILARHSLTAACFVSTDLIGTTRRFPHDQGSAREFAEAMNWDQVRGLAEGGWTIGGHGATHARLSDCSRDQLTFELSKPLSELQSKVGMVNVAMSYPFGQRDDITSDGLALGKELGYRACMSDFGGENFPPVDAFHVKRIDVGGDQPDIAWKARVHGIDLARWGVRWRALLAFSSNEAAPERE
jgi:peptidoglycan/xylan/chitin deacetylase (PgdA/CDA1 family)/folate-dependent phosphoribosylglycinamide formyltransferase PurN